MYAWNSPVSASSAKMGASGKLSTLPTRGRSSEAVRTKLSKPISASKALSTSSAASLWGVRVKVNSRYFISEVLR